MRTLTKGNFNGLQATHADSPEFAIAIWDWGRGGTVIADRLAALGPYQGRWPV